MLSACLWQVSCCGICRLGLSMCMTTAWQSRSGSDMLTGPRAGPGAEGRAFLVSLSMCASLVICCNIVSSTSANHNCIEKVSHLPCHAVHTARDSFPARWTHAMSTAHAMLTRLRSINLADVSFRCLSKLSHGVPGTWRTTMRGQNQAW